ncbi:MAG: hypothetical protein RBS80_21515 [Thermoguttaceae bacterium]|jgi:L-fucose isomerase-like protein|nr:hypothetical protein [Thermoguttaceae bacterium]
MDKLRVGYACLARLSFDGEYAREVMQRSRKALAAMDNVELICPGDLTVEEQDAEEAAAQFNRERADVAVIQYGTFSLGSLMPLLADRLSVPIAIWGVPEPSLGGKLRLNSLCGVNMNAHTLMRLGRKYETLFCTPEEGPAELGQWFRVLHCLRRLRHVRLGLVGYRVPGFYTSNCDELDLRRRLGVELHHVTLAEVYAEAAKTDPAAREHVIESIRASACTVEVQPEELDKAAALYLALKALAAKYRLDSLAVKCWPEFPESYGVVACWAISRLNDDGILTSCEGDVYGAVMMLAANYLTGKTPMFADFVAIDEPKNLGIGWHCGAAPTCLAADPEQVAVCKHPTAGGGKLGVAVGFPIGGGMPATMARLGVGPDGLRLFFAGGEAVDPGPILRGNPAGIRFQSPARRVLKTILDNGVEHHFVMVHADIRPELRSMAKWLDLPVIDGDQQ